MLEFLVEGYQMNEHHCKVLFRIFHKQRRAAFIKQTTCEINCNLLVKKAIFSVSNFASFMLPVDQLSYRYTIY